MFDCTAHRLGHFWIHRLIFSKQKILMIRTFNLILDLSKETPPKCLVFKFPARSYISWICRTEHVPLTRINPPLSTSPIKLAQLIKPSKLTWWSLGLRLWCPRSTWMGRGIRRRRGVWRGWGIGRWRGIRRWWGVWRGRGIGGWRGIWRGRGIGRCWLCSHWTLSFEVHQDAITICQHGRGKINYFIYVCRHIHIQRTRSSWNVKNRNFRRIVKHKNYVMRESLLFIIYDSTESSAQS